MPAFAFKRSRVVIFGSGLIILTGVLIVLTGNTDSTETGMIYPDSSVTNRVKLVNQIMKDPTFNVTKVDIQKNNAINILISNPVTEQTKEYFEKTYRLAYHGFEKENVISSK